MRPLFPQLISFSRHFLELFLYLETLQAGLVRILGVTCTVPAMRNHGMSMGFPQDWHQLHTHSRTFERFVCFFQLVNLGNVSAREDKPCNAFVTRDSIAVLNCPGKQRAMHACSERQRTFARNGVST